jgi:hypothetical protein
MPQSQLLTAGRLAQADFRPIAGVVAVSGRGRVEICLAAFNDRLPFVDILVARSPYQR